ncbi:M81 family metallopeptidase [Pandoraea pnomenusa]|uniref:M81 family metallopeptidase n=1 Tax=Pandoraea pnomenusa TaxID=93220 RepID=UPI00333E98EC
MARIGIGGFLHETNTFALKPTRLTDFIAADAWPGLLCGDEMFEACAGVNLALSGFVEASAGQSLVPLVWCSANPGGPVTEDAFEAVALMLSLAIRDAGPLDALFLDLHGAMVCEHLNDGEGDLLRRLRRQIGADVPIVAALDFHANVSDAMCREADVLVPYRTYPHVDMADTGRRAAQIMRRLLTGQRPAKAWRQLPFLIPMQWQSTLAEPAASLMAQARTMSDAPGTWLAALVPGFPLADVPDSSPSVLVYADEAGAADLAAASLAEAVEGQREAFGGVLHSPSEAAAIAKRHDGAGAIILADTQDNPGGGAAGDTTDLLHALVREDVSNALAGVVCDATFAAAAHRAGVGATLQLPLGAASGIGAGPLAAEFDVVALGDGQFVGTGPFYLGCRMDLGPMARVRTGGLEIVVSSRKQQAADQAMFRHLGAEPSAYRILVLKSSVHFRADFLALAGEILMVAAPGVNVADLRQLDYRHLRKGVRV